MRERRRDREQRKDEHVKHEGQRGDTKIGTLEWLLEERREDDLNERN